jgi:hypothetical protein
MTHSNLPTPQSSTPNLFNYYLIQDGRAQDCQAKGRRFIFRLQRFFNLHPSCAQKLVSNEDGNGKIMNTVVSPQSEHPNSEQFLDGFLDGFSGSSRRRRVFALWTHNCSHWLVTQVILESGPPLGGEGKACIAMFVNLSNFHNDHRRRTYLCQDSNSKTGNMVKNWQYGPKLARRRRNYIIPATSG